MMLVKEDYEQTLDAIDDTNDEFVRYLLNIHQRRMFDDIEAQTCLGEMLISFSSSHRQPTADGRKHRRR